MIVETIDQRIRELILIHMQKYGLPETIALLEEELRRMKALQHIRENQFASVHDRPAEVK